MTITFDWWFTTNRIDKATGTDLELVNLYCKPDESLMIKYGVAVNILFHVCIRHFNYTLKGFV